MNALTELARRADHRGVSLGIETGTEPGDVLADLLDRLGTAALGASIDPGALLASRIDPIPTTRSLGSRVVHAYARDASGLPTSGALWSGSGFPAVRSTGKSISVRSRRSIIVDF